MIAMLRMDVVLHHSTSWRICESRLGMLRAVGNRSSFEGEIKSTIGRCEEQLYRKEVYELEQVEAVDL